MIRRERDLKRRLLSPDMTEESTFMGGREGKEGKVKEEREKRRREIQTGKDSKNKCTEKIKIPIHL
jgi:hypothetical protein